MEEMDVSQKKREGETTPESTWLHAAACMGIHVGGFCDTFIQEKPIRLSLSPHSVVSLPAAE